MPDYPSISPPSGLGEGPILRQGMPMDLPLRALAEGARTALSSPPSPHATLALTGVVAALHNILVGSRQSHPGGLLVLSPVQQSTALSLAISCVQALVVVLLAEAQSGSISLSGRAVGGGEGSAARLSTRPLLEVRYGLNRVGGLFLI